MPSSAGSSARLVSSACGVTGRRSAGCPNRLIQATRNPNAAPAYASHPFDDWKLTAVAGIVCLFSIAPVAEAQRTTVEVEVSAAPGSTRVLLTHSRQLGYDLRVLDGKIEIVYAGRVLVQPERRRLDDPILTRFTSKGHERLVLHTGRAFRRP